MKNVLILILLFTSTYSMAQYFEAELLMANGETMTGFAKLPSNGVLDTNVEFKKTNKGKVQKLAHDDLSQIIYTSKTGSQYLFERNSAVHLFKSFGKVYEKEKVNKHWMLLIHRNASLNQYSLAQRYRLDKKGRMTSITGGNSFWGTIYFLFKRSSEDKAYIVSGKGFTNGMVRKAMAIYFEDLPEFVARINNKEFKKSSVNEVADAYDSYFD